LMIAIKVGASLFTSGHRPHSLLGHLTPDELYRRSQAQPTAKEVANSTLVLSR